MKKIFVYVVLLVVSAGASAAGFDIDYDIQVGHYDADGLLDLFVSSKAIVIPVDDVPIVIPPAVRQFVLRNDSAGDFELITAPLASKIAEMRSWPLTDLPISVSDVNVDGFNDLTIRDTSLSIPSTRGQIIFAGQGRNKSPIHIRSIDASFSKYKTDFLAWLADPNYFDNAPLKVVGQQPATAVWDGSIINPTNVRAINSALAGCTARYPSGVCATNSVDPPPPCVRTVDVRDENGNYLGTRDEDVCQYDIHVYVYTPGSVQVVADTSVFDTDARDTADAIDRLDTCPARPIIPADVATEIERIMARVFRSGGIFDRNGPFTNTSNSIRHPPFPGDGAFPPADPTYHHFDGTTRLCRLGSSLCNPGFFFNNVSRRFTFPYVGLRPHDVSLNGVDREMIYVSPGVAGLIDVPGSYFVPIGHITQTQISGGYWAGAVQNVTANDHLMWPGTVNRALIEDRGYLTGFTHGIGYNKQLCTTLLPDVGYNVLLALVNDVYGHGAFQALDMAMLKYYRNMLARNAGGNTDEPPASAFSAHQ